MLIHLAFAHKITLLSVKITLSVLQNIYLAQHALLYPFSQLSQMSINWCGWMFHCCSFSHGAHERHLGDYTNSLQYWFLSLSAASCTFTQTVQQLIQRDFVSLSVWFKKKSILSLFSGCFWFVRHFTIILLLLQCQCDTILYYTITYTWTAFTLMY